MIILVAFPGNTTIPDANSTSVDPTEVFKTIFYNIPESLPFLIVPIYYEPQAMLIHLEDLSRSLSMMPLPTN